MAEPKKEVELTHKGKESFTIRPGAYHRATGIPQDEPIPMKRIEADIKKGGKIGRMARSAKGLKSMHKKGESRRDANGYPYVRPMSEKEHPGGAKGTVRGHKTTAKQQKLFGIARGMQKGKTSPGYSPQAAEIAGHMSSKETKKVASKPKGGHRPSPSESYYQEAEDDKKEFVTKFRKYRYDHRNPKTGQARQNPHDTAKDKKNESVLMREAEARVMQLVQEEEERQEREKNGNNSVPFKKRIPVGSRHPGEAGKTSQKGKPTWFGSGHRSSADSLHKKGGD